MEPDKKLLQPRKVVSIERAPDGVTGLFGFWVVLYCGHRVWSMIEPRVQLYCGQCADRYAIQTHEAARLGEPRRRKHIE